MPCWTNKKRWKRVLQPNRMHLKKYRISFSMTDDDTALTNQKIYKKTKYHDAAFTSPAYTDFKRCVSFSKFDWKSSPKLAESPFCT